MVSYHLFYFPVRGRAEAIRQLFLLQGTKYEETKITQEEWPQYKEKMPLSQVPVLEVDGQQLAQTVSILRFLGNQFKRSGKNAIEAARLDMIAEVVQEMSSQSVISKWNRTMLGMIEGDKDEVFKNEIRPVIEQFAPIIERFLVENGGNGLLLGDSETWVDVYACEMFVRFRDFGSADALAAYPNIQKLIERVHNIPAIKEHIANREPVPC